MHFIGSQPNEHVLDDRKKIRNQSQISRTKVENITGGAALAQTNCRQIKGLILAKKKKNLVAHSQRQADILRCYHQTEQKQAN